MPDFFRIEVFDRAEERERGAIVVSGDYNREDCVLTGEDRTDVFLILPGDSFIRRVSNVGMSVGTDPAEVKGVRHLPGRFTNIIQADSDRRILTAGAARNI